MSYLAVLHEQPASLVITCCHINIWRSRNWMRPYSLFDLGIGLKLASGKRRQEIQVALPFFTNNFRDLKPVLLENDTATLVFGEPITCQPVDDAAFHWLTSAPPRDEGKAIKLRLASCKGERLPEFDAQNGSVWRITPQIALDESDEAYVRMRFVCRGGAIWATDRDGGAVVDLRIADTRGAVAHKSWSGFAGQLVSIQGLNAFVITPAFLVDRASSPDFSYVRLLEHGVWSNYLNGRNGFGGKMVVRHWRHGKPEAPISGKNPFAGFLQLGQSPRSELRRFALLVIPLLAIAVVLVQEQWRDVASLLMATWNGSLGQASGGRASSWILLVFGGVVTTLKGVKTLLWAWDRWSPELKRRSGR